MAVTVMFLSQKSLQSQKLSLVDTLNEIRRFGSYTSRRYDWYDSGL